MLAGSLSALLNRLPARSVRLVVFNLERQSVLLRKDNFTLAGIEEVTKAINEIQLGVVDYKTLQNAGGPIELLTGLIRAELQASEPSDEVVFLGPETRTAKPIPKNDLGNTHPARRDFTTYNTGSHPRGFRGDLGRELQRPREGRPQDSRTTERFPIRRPPTASRKRSDA